MIIRDALKKGTDIIKSAGIETPTLEAGVILCHVLGRDKIYIYTHGDNELQPSQEEKYFELLKKRTSGVPVQHITGTQEFMSLPFRVNEHVLIPRQDTEILVETVMEWVKNQKTQSQDKVKIMDIGTGSGCIAVSLAYYIGNSFITAVDISEMALRTARLNAEANNVADRIIFIHSNLFEDIPSEYFGGLYDVIVSNPPYIPTEDIKHLQKEVRCFDPLVALDGGQDGLEFYRAIINRADDFLKPGGLLALEVGFGQADAVAALMKGKFEDIRKTKDLSGIERVVSGCRETAL
ncbi:MAG TPA: peptide chain release factor N(5)-glutamine methyltransferase [Clostridiaceae bacterium]|nr:peptide chain release factor N(5)-glutamine methyltransferase [Clostridiaceae bacterium]